MKAILSTTYEDLYLFYLPITAWAWNRIDIGIACFLPNRAPIEADRKMLLIAAAIEDNDISCQYHGFAADATKEATYAQCSRLYGAALPKIANDEVLITGDIDMAVFNRKYFDELNDGYVHVVGTDLVPDGQYPMCYIAMPASTWRDGMWIMDGESVQKELDQLLGHLDCEHFRGNYWAKDQETAFNHISASGLPVIKHNRAKPGTQFATRRADRDGWPEVILPDIIDAHLPRPGYTPENFAKILNLFQAMYPEDNFDWMIEYRNEYVKLINP
jgi:hypothetical protein